MRKPSVLLFAAVLSVCICVPAQNTGARATPQAAESAPASAGTPASPAVTPVRPRPARRGGTAGRGGASAAHSNGTAAAGSPGTQATAANASVGVIGDSDGDGLLDHAGAGSDGPALPGIVMVHNSLGVAAGTPIQVRLQQAIDSGHAHNGDVVHGALAATLGKIQAGAPVILTVVAAAAAGQLTSNGVLSLQVVSVNGEQILSQVVTAEGKEGQKILADDAPTRGTEAVFQQDTPITLPAA